MATAYGFAAGPTIEEALEAVREGAALITANQRLARGLRERHNAARVDAGESVWAAPEILPWNAWLTALWGELLYHSGETVLPVLTADQETYTWESIIRRSPEADRLLSVSSVADAASRSWALMHEWQLDRGEIERAANEDTLAFLGWCDSFEDFCRDREWLDSARMPDALAASLGSVQLPGRVLLAGFDELTPQRRAFIAACESAGSRVELVGPPVAAAGSAIRVSCATRSEEAAFAARWARSLVEGGATGIAVVVPDLAERRNEITRVFRDVFDPASVLPSRHRAMPFNLSAGAALRDYPLIRSALLALALDSERNEIGQCGAFLRSRYLRGADEERSARAAIDARLRRMGVSAPSLHLVRKVSRMTGCEAPILRRALASWQRLRNSLPSRQRPGAWARSFSMLLTKLGWPGDRALASDEYQASEAWARLLSDFARLEAVGAQFSYSEALSRLQRMASEAMFQPQSEAAAVQILGSLEAAGARFDHLWIAGLDDDSWPPPAKPDPFLPAVVQRAHSLPHSSAERELEFARLRTERLLSAAADIVVSHALRDADRELAPSPLIRVIPAAEFTAPEYPNYAGIVRASAATEQFEDPAGPPAAGGVRGGTNILRYQALCPFRAFAEVRLGAIPLETPEEGLGRRDRGTLIHAALDHLWGLLGSHQRLSEVSTAELAEAIRESVSAALEEIGGRRGGALPPRFAELERTRLEMLLEMWLDLERERAPFVVAEREVEREVEINGIRVKVRIDRIDRLEDGRTVVIDYKTGEASASDWEGDRPSEPQVPLYAIGQDGTLAAAALARLKTGKLGFKGIASDKSLLPGISAEDLKAKLQEWRATLDALAARFRTGCAEVDPKEPAVCRNCSLAGLCRIAEVELETSALSGEGN